ncbi:MAG: helix-turn-helix domain-containing protein [Streptosporangiaceae bacterium]
MSQPARRYVSEVRDEQARRTRRAIVTAARDLFLAQGYAATTIDAIAEAAHVSRRTVFNAVGGKVVLLKLALEWAIVADDEPVALADRPAIRAIQAERDPRRALALWVNMVVDIAARVAPIGAVLYAAADGDPEAAELLANEAQLRTTCSSPSAAGPPPRSRSGCPTASPPRCCGPADKPASAQIQARIRAELTICTKACA